MSIALHIDSRVMISLRQHRDELVGRKSPATYIAMPPDDAEKQLLERARIPYATCEGGTLVFGRHAEELAPLLHVPRLPILPEGRLPEDDPVGRQLAAAITDAIVPEPLIRGERCAIVLPLSIMPPLDETREWQFFSRLVRLRGFEPLAIDGCAALALAGLGHAGFTGMSLLIDSTASGLAFVHRGRVLVRAVIPRGGDWIDEQLARKTERLVWDMDGACYVDMDAIVRWKRERAPQLHAPQNDEVQLLAYLYEQLLQELLAAFAAACAGSSDLPTMRQPFSITCCGAATGSAGFAQLLAEQVQRARLPMTVTELRSPDDTEFAIARGALIQAEIESTALARPSAA